MPRPSHYHIFSLPSELFDGLTPRNTISTALQPPAELSQPESSEPIPEQTAAGARACNVCLGTSFKDVEEQRSHFRSDWHRYNVKVRLNGGKPVSASEFARLIEGVLIGSISESLFLTLD